MDIRIFNHIKEFIILSVVLPKYWSGVPVFHVKVRGVIHYPLQLYTNHQTKNCTQVSVFKSFMKFS